MHTFNFRSGLLHCFFAVGGIVSLSSCADSTEKQAPEWKTLTEAVYASGMVVPLNEYKVFANTDGILSTLYVVEGDLVKKDELLFGIISESRQVQEAVQGKLYETILDKGAPDGPAMKELELKLSLSQKKVETDSIHFFRLSRLLESDAISRAEWEQSRLKYESAQSERLAIEEQRKNLLLLSKLESRQVESQYKTLRAQNKEGQVRSRLNGVVFEIYKKTGERVSINEPVALIGDSGNWIARLTIDERDYSLIKEGQAVHIKMDAFPDSTFRAKIHRVLPRLNRSEQSFIAEAFFEGNMPTAIYGLNLEANIVVREKVKALTVPKKALFSADSVRVQRNGEVLEVKIIKGIQSKDYVEVLGGLDSTDLVILPR